MPVYPLAMAMFVGWLRSPDGYIDSVPPRLLLLDGFGLSRYRVHSLFIIVPPCRFHMWLAYRLQYQ